MHFHGAERGRAFGLLGMVTSLAVAVAPALGGGLIDLGGAHWGWRLAFLVNVPLGLAGALLAWRWLPSPLFVRRTTATPARTGLLAALDPVGALLAALAVLVFLLPFVEGRAAGWAWLGVPAGVALGLAWLAWERGYAARCWPAMVDLGLFRIASFSNGLGVQTLYFLGMTSVWVLVALYAQEAAGWSAFATGLLGMPSAILAALASRWAGQRIVHQGRRLVVYGQCLALAALTLARVPPAQAGSAGALVSVSQRIGASVGIAVVTGSAFAAQAYGGWSAAVGAGFGLILLLMAAGTVLSIIDWRQERRGRG